ncbi:MAG: hypothetical protein LBE04_05230, partial [Prevotellaceae bacterium]|nr:hypothetical protein [Prevotellaceae bacterium]
MNTFTKRIAIFLYLLTASIFGLMAQTTQTPGGVTANYTWHVWLTPETYSNGVWTNKIANGIGHFKAPETAPVKLN